MLKAKKLTLADFEFDAYAEKEELTPIQSMKGGGAEETELFNEAVKSAKQKASGIWGWCTVKVTGVLIDDNSFTGVEYLGCCSYENKQDFVDSSGYYDDMCRSIVRDVQKQLDGYVSVANQKMSNGLIGILPL
jgi:hypothetical protein